MSRPKLGRAVPPHERHPVAWYQPDVLWTAARQVLSSLDQQRNRDGRESQVLPLVIIDRSQPEADGDCQGEFWFDFIADTGDGGSACYAVASAAMADELHLAATSPTLPPARTTTATASSRCSRPCATTSRPASCAAGH